MDTTGIRPNLKYAVLFVALAFLPLAGIALAEHKPTPKAKILQPGTNQTLSGEVEVKLTLPAGLSGPVYAGLGGPPWVELQQVEDANERRGRINSKMVPNGSQKLIVKTTSKRADVAVDVRVDNPLRVYFSDLHSHTGYSDGTLLPEVAHRYARKVAKLDVFVLTDHLEYVDDNEWLDMRETAWDASEDGRFVAIPGLEWTKKIGHLNIYDPGTRRWPLDLSAFYKAAADARVICKFNHPGDGSKVFNGLAYSETGDRALQLMEVRRPTEEQAYIRALQLGWHIAPDGSDDTHGPNWGSRFAWSGILAPGLTKRNILDALAKRRCYSTLDRNCILRFKINGANMGEIIEEPAIAVAVMVAAIDPDADDVISKIELFEDGVIVQTDEPKSNRRRWNTRFRPKAGAHFYFVKLTQKDGNMMWSAPIWLTVADD
jgi:hypothetical protein